MFISILTCALAFCTCLARITEKPKDGDGETHVVLIAGSGTYMNYRHQADVCHAFHVLSDIGGISPDNIIVMMADDIANNSLNPYPGNIINRPGGPNVYPGVPKDWTGDNVNANNFLRVLTGDGDDDEKVLRSGPKDSVFIYYADHGARGMLGMPHGDFLMANNLTDALHTMHKKRMYKEMVFYIEACESGSMFEGNLPPNMHIYGATAATPDQSSYACYYDESRQTYLGDQWSVSWIEDSEANMTTGQTLLQQFLVAKDRTTESQAQHYGDLIIDKEEVVDFQGSDTAEPAEMPPPKYSPLPNSVSSRDVRLSVLKHRWNIADRLEKMRLQQLIDEEIIRRTDIEYTFRGIVSTVVNATSSDVDSQFNYWLNLNEKPRDWDGLRIASRVFETTCYKFDEYSLQFWTVLVSLVEVFGPLDVLEAIRKQCTINYGASDM
jgi:legumain